MRTGVLRGLSIEFAATRERMVSGVRSVIAARLSGIAVVDRAAYPQSSVEAAVGFIARSLSTATVTPANNLTSGDGVVHFRVNSDFAWRVRAPARIGPEPNETQAELRTGTGRSIIAAFGLSPSMFESGSDGTAQRESFRRARPIEGVVESGDGLQGSSRLRDQRSGGSGNSRVLTINGLFRGKASGRWAIGRY